MAARRYSLTLQTPGPTHSKTKIGYDVPLNRLFYVYESPRQLEDIESNLHSLESEFSDFMAELTKGLPSNAAPTAGINRAPRLKPSETEWMADVPKHWDIKKLKYTTSTNDDVITENEDPLRELLYVDIGSISPPKVLLPPKI